MKLDVPSLHLEQVMANPSVTGVKNAPSVEKSYKLSDGDGLYFLVATWRRKNLALRLSLCRGPADRRTVEVRAVI